MRQSETSLEKPIHVFLLRRTTVSIGRWKNVEEEVLGVGRVFPNPITTIEPILENSATLSWDGEIHCEQPVEYSSFTTSVVEVRVSPVYIFWNLANSNIVHPGFLGALIARSPWPAEIHSPTTLSGVSYPFGHTFLPILRTYHSHHLFKILNYTRVRPALYSIYVYIFVHLNDNLLRFTCE